MHHHHSYGSHHAKKSMHHRPPMSRVRAIHNVAKGPKVNINIDGKNSLSGVGFEAISDYLKVPSGNHNVSIETEDGTPLANTDVYLEPGSDYTVIAHGPITDLSKIGLLALKDNNTCPANGKAHVRFVHAAAGAPAVDIWANSKDKIFSNVSYGSAGNPVYLPVDQGNVTLSVAPANTNNVVLGPLPLKLKNKTVYTVVASGLVGDNQAPLSALVSEDSNCSTVNYMPLFF